MSDELDTLRSAFEESQEVLRMAVFEALRAPQLNRYKTEDALKKYFEKQAAYLSKMHERIAELSKNQVGHSG